MDSIFDNLIKIAKATMNDLEFIKAFDEIRKFIFTYNELIEMQINEFAKKISSIVDDLKIYEINGTYYLCNGNKNKCFGQITISPEKEKLYFYVINKYRKQKVFYNKIDDEIKNDKILKFVKYLVNNVLKTNNYRKIEFNNFNSNFNKNLFKKNIENDLGIKIIHFKIHTNKNSYIFKYEGKVPINKIVDYIIEYLDILKDKVELPKIIEIKE